MSKRFGLALWLATCAAGCAPPEPLPPRRVELAEVDAPRLWRETAALDIGSEAARPALWSGWGPDENSPIGTFAWGGGTRSRIVFALAAPRDLTLRLRGWSYPFHDGKGQEVRVVVNGEEVGRRTLPVEATTLAVEVPARRLRAGENLLDLVYARFVRAPDESPWAAAWDGLRLDGAVEEGPPPLVDAALGAIELPAGWTIEWAEPPAAAYFAWDRLASSGGARLQVRTPAGEPRVASETTGRVRLHAPGPDTGSPATFALAAIGERGSVRLEGARFHLPETTNRQEPAPTAPLAAKPPHLVVYLIDTLRADRLGCYGYERPTSPRIDDFARSALLFREGRAQSSWTRPAVATLLTGLAPWEHGVEQRSSKLPDSIATLSERLRQAGYETALFTTNANIVARFGFDQGWDTFATIFDRVRGSRRHVDSATIHRHVVDWLEQRESRGETRPFFLFVHTLDPHDPYRPAEPFRRALAADVDVESACCGGAEALARKAREDPVAGQVRAAAAARLYDAEVAENDASFGALLDELDRRGLAAATAVLLTSDHGEEFLEHGGLKHGFTLYEEMLRVPLLLRLPGEAPAGRIVAEPADQIDVAPTLLALAGLPPDRALPGRSLLAPLPAARLSAARLVRGDTVLESAKREGWKVVRRRGPWTPPLGEPPWRLFDLAADALELQDLALERRGERLALAAALERAIGGGTTVAGEAAEIDPELDRALKALGYI